MGGVTGTKPPRLVAELGLGVQGLIFQAHVLSAIPTPFFFLLPALGTYRSQLDITEPGCPEISFLYLGTFVFLFLLIYFKLSLSLQVLQMFYFFPH